MSPADAFRTTLDLFEAGVEIMRQTLRRNDTTASDEMIERQLNAWLCHRPGAEAGDGAGRPVTLDARRR